jgi:hypothetical protein
MEAEKFGAHHFLCSAEKKELTLTKILSTSFFLQPMVL